MSTVALLKTGALGDVLRTTSIVPGLARREEPLVLTWVTAPAAVDLVRHHPLVTRVVAVDPARADFVAAALAELKGERFDLILSLDDEAPVCHLASQLAQRDGSRISGAHASASGALVYTADVAPWFDMGLLSVHGRTRADELKRENGESHPVIHARMLNLPVGRTRLDVDESARRWAEAHATKIGIDGSRQWVGLNTGAGGRWVSKRLPEDRTAELVLAAERARPGQVGFVLLGGESEAQRNARIAARLADSSARCLDAGVTQSVLEFAALVDRLDALVSSDSLALHIAVARGVPVVCFFAPTSAAEIELWGRGTKVVSTAPDACSYRPDADTSTLTVARLVEPLLHWLDVGRLEPRDATRARP